MLEQNLDWIKTKDENGQYVWQGSMENEYLTRSDTAENSIQLAKNAWRNLRESFGEAFLPVVKQGADWFVGFAKEVEANAPLIAGVTGQLAQLAQNGISALGGALESLWQIVKKFFEFINVKSENGSYDNSATVTKVIGGTAATFAAMSVAPQILQVVNGATRIFGGGKGTGPLSVAKDSIFGKGAAAAGNTVDMWNAAKLGAGLANSSMTQANGSPVTSSGIGGFLQNAENTIIGTIFGLKNKKQLTSKTSKPETLWKNVLKTADQITAAKSSGGLFGMLKGSSLGQYGTSVANSVKGLHGTNLVQQTIGVGKWLGQTAKNGVGGIASSLAGIFGSPMQNAMNSPLGNFITSIGQKAVGLGKGAVGGVKNFAGNTLYGAKTLAGNIASSKVGQTAVKIGGGAVQGVKDVTQFLGAGLNVGQTVLGPVAGKLGGAFMGLLGTFGPVIAGIGSIIAVVSLLGDHFADIQQIVLKVFGPTGLKIFNTFFADVKKIGDGIKNAFSLDNLLNIQEKLSGKSMFGVDLGQAFGAAIPIIQSVTGLVSQIVDLGVNHIKPLLADVMSFVVNELFPAVAPLISTIIDLVGTTLVNAIKVIVDVIHGLLPVIEPVIQGIIGLIKGIASIGVSVVNTIIRALNKIHIKMPTKILGISLPEGIAGKEWGFSLAEVPAPAFANGGFTHGVSIAGEAGTEAVISFKRSVHDENVNHWVRAGRMLGVTGEDATRAIGPQNVSYFANGGFTDGSREKLDNLIDFSKAYGEYALRSNGIRTAGDAASLLWSVTNNSMAGDGSLALAATSIAADVAPIVLKKYLGDNEATSLLTEAAKTYNGGTVLSSWENGVLTDTGVPLYVLPPRDAGTTELSEIPQAAYRSSRTSGGGDGDGDGMQFVFSPQITAYGKADRAEIEQIMREQFEKFKAEIKREIKEEQRREQRTKYA